MFFKSKNVDSRKKSRNQTCRHERINAARCHWLCQCSPWKIQHWKRHCSLHQERIRQEVQSNLALCCWQKLWFLCDSWDQTFHLLLHGTSCNSLVQVRLRIFWLINDLQYISLLCDLNYTFYLKNWNIN